MHSPSTDSRDVAERFAQSAAFEILEELGYGDQWTTALVELCNRADIRADLIDRHDMEHLLLEVLPHQHWRPPDHAHALAQEMRAFWMFSLFELDNPNAGNWADLVGSDLDDDLAFVLRRAGSHSSQDERL